MTVVATPGTWRERLWLRVAVGEPDECWEWTGYRRPRGYGQMGLGGGRRFGIGETHRLAYEWQNGPIPKGMVVRHTCDNPPCCNPAHLLIGTHADNVRDAVVRNRVARGFRLPHTRLSEDQVREIRARFRRFPSPPGKRGYRSNAAELAIEFGVSKGYIQQIKYGHERRSVA